jgi:hypothetical protein
MAFTFAEISRSGKIHPEMAFWVAFDLLWPPSLFEIKSILELFA